MSDEVVMVWTDYKVLLGVTGHAFVLYEHKFVCSRRHVHVA